MGDRDWRALPYAANAKPEPKPLPPETYVAMWVFLVAPLFAWGAAAWPEAAAIWPGGWILAVSVALGGIAVRDRRPR
ncbi:MAG: hypothetical protein ACRDS1_00730 [Pseudonocardiaceae bacterium]